MPLPITNPFTQGWIQALMQATEVPASRTIKSKIEWIDILSQDRPDQDRLAAARELWNYCETEGLMDLLKIIPTSQSIWQFSRDDIFTYQRRDSSPANLSNLESWTRAIGLQPATFELMAEVTAGDWTELVRNEAVRLKQSLNTAAVSQSSIKHLPCIARWADNLWSVQFDQVDWIIVRYEDFVSVPRPPLEAIEETIAWALANAHDSILTKSGSSCAFALERSIWMDCVEKLKPIHQLVLSNSRDFSPWFNRAWDCVWPVVYREQNLLNGKADINWIRGEIKACLTAQPRLTVWMFMFAKLTCQIMVGRGLGQCADFVDF
jgi:hypothetical protein